MAKRKLLTVLYFLAGCAPTKDEQAEIDSFGEGHVVRQRNASLIHDDECLEEFDIVAGSVPANYAEAAAEKGEPPEPPQPPAIDPDTVDAGSPLAPPEGAQEGGEAGSGTSDAAGAAEGATAPASEAAATTETATVVPPKPKGGGRGGWKPNA